jgi:hypothetical protein
VLALLSFGTFKFCGPLFECFVNPFDVVESLLAAKATEEVLLEVVRLGMRKSSIEVVVQLLACPRLNADKFCL